MKDLMEELFSVRMEDPRNAPARLHRVTFRLRRACATLPTAASRRSSECIRRSLRGHLEDHIENMTHNIGMWSSTRLERSG